MQSFSPALIRTALVVTVHFLLICIFFGLVNAAEPILFFQPDNSTSAAFAAADDTSEEYIGRRGNVLFSARELFFPGSPDDQPKIPAAGMLDQQELRIAFFTDQDIRIVIDYQSVADNGILNLRGRQTSAAISTFSMTMNRKNYLVSLQDMASGLLYKVDGDTDSGVGRVTEYDLAKLPPVIDDMPLSVPEKP